MRNWLRPVIPRTLSMQLIVLTAAAVLLSNLAVAAWFTATHDRAAESAMMEHLLDRAASAATVLTSIPEHDRARAAHTMSSGPWHFVIAKGPAAAVAMDADEAALAVRARALLPEDRQGYPVSVKVYAPGELTRNLSALGHRGAHRHRPLEHMIVVTLPIEPGTNLIASFGTPGGPPWPWPFLYAVIVAVVSASAAAAFAARRVARPLSKLAAAARAVAHGGEAPRLAEEGPDDVRHAAQAFNAMTHQVRRVMDSQRQLLSAVGHDLRTPITALRIAAEFIAEAETRESIEKNLDELQALTEAVLSAVRGAGWEKPRRVDLSALVESVCTDLEEMGQPVEFTAHAPMAISCRSDEIRRAVRNLLENAVAYGKAARVRIEEQSGSVDIVIDDDGPGIPEADLAHVFDPFVRLEQSRNADTGGAGLGLTLVKTIAEGHGGTVVLQNRSEGGLRAILHLPRGAEAA